MALFYYEGKKINGELVKGTLEANTNSEVVVALRRQSVYPTKITKEEVTSSMNVSFDFSMKKVTSKDLAVFCRQFSTIINAGIPVVECVEILRKQSENKLLRESLDDIYEDVQKGLNLSASMRKYKKVFPDILVNMVAAGEISGALDVIMNRMMHHYDKEHKLQQKISGAMVYPIIMIVACIGVIIVLMTQVLPTFVDMFASLGVKLPALTIALMAVSNFLKQFWYLFIGMVLLAIYSFKRSLSSAEGRVKFDDFKLRVPIVGPVNQKVATARFSRSLATMLSSGINIIEAIEIVNRVLGNQALAYQIQESMDRLKKGEGISGPLSQIKVFPPMLISMIRIGEETGSLDKMLESTADFYDDEVSFAIDKMVSLINPLILLVMATVVGFIVIAVAMPMFEMVNAVQNSL